ncbi:hypothetical protein J8273_6428 [Carpediemonas membranifera]|uniref:Uncharacterized protein n=1 Tax=Carpediemonas membranifera TaxID=201153 RepID=A0A8J6AQZ8_9EUKA|nr:hypothetical protein J8273_6428 [Carpediemonas membranifera]|eukprot:KAG9391663.1 hypothetical protein J8273_6428 [Carpediemonas membranifera]
MDSIRTVANNSVTFSFWHVNADDLDSGKTKEQDVDHTFTMSDVFSPFTGGFNMKSDKAAATPHIFLRAVEDKISSHNYVGTKLAETTIASRPGEMPMFCLDNYLYVCTQLEILKYNLNLELQANITLGTSGATYTDILPYNMNGVSLIVVGTNDASQVVVTSVDTGFTAIVSSITTDEFDSLSITDLDSRLIAIKGGDGDSSNVHYGFIDYEASSTSWVWTHDDWFNVTSGGCGVEINDDQLNNVVAITKSTTVGEFPDVTVTYTSSLAEPDLTPIADSVSGFVNYNFQTSTAMKFLMGVYEDFLVEMAFKGGETDNSVTTTIDFHFADSAAWIRASLLASLLALALLA